MLEVPIPIPTRLRGLETTVTEGWRAFFDDKDISDCPYLLDSLYDEAWRYGFNEAVDYGS